MSFQLLQKQQTMFAEMQFFEGPNPFVPETPGFLGKVLLEKFLRAAKEGQRTP
jgi:hypothetical protein